MGYHQAGGGQCKVGPANPPELVRSSQETELSSAASSLTFPWSWADPAGPGRLSTVRTSWPQAHSPGSQCSCCKDLFAPWSPWSPLPPLHTALARSLPGRPSAGSLEPSQACPQPLITVSDEDVDMLIYLLAAPQNVGFLSAEATPQNPQKCSAISNQ